jgi:hypothetical protein
MAKHKWKRLRSGEIDEFAVEGGFCNGPICVECGHSFCEHCQPEEWDSECPGRPGFEFRTGFNPLNWMVGVCWNRRGKTLILFILCFSLFFDFSGLFPYCEEVRED